MCLLGDQMSKMHMIRITVTINSRKANMTSRKKNMPTYNDDNLIIESI